MTTTIREWATNPDNREDVLETIKVIGGDGHTIFKPEAFTPYMPDYLITEYTIRYDSDPDSGPTATLYSNNVPVEYVEGVYGLPLAESIGNALGVESHKGGRGSRCREVCEKVRERLEAS